MGLFFGFFLILCLAECGCSKDKDINAPLTEHQDVHQDPQATGGTTAEFVRCTKGVWRVPGQYIVVLQKGSHDSHVERLVATLRAQAAKKGHIIHIPYTYSGAFHGFLVKMSSDILPLALKLPHIDYIEEDSSIFAQGIPWNLEHIIQTKHEAGKYTPPNDGAKITVYLMDTSVQASHREIKGRVMVTDFNSVPEEDGIRNHRQASECESHGTHIAGVVSGQDSGVARGVSINTVRVLNCQGKGTVSSALAGLEYIRASLQVQPIIPVIVLLPFVGGFSRTLNTACREMVQSGVVIIAAAGNYQDDACLYSPASEPEVITVGATNAADQLLSLGNTGTNLGRCVNLFAPGKDIISASSDCPTCFTTKSGTSQAAALVAGIAAVLLNEKPSLSPAEVLQLLNYHSVQRVINPSLLPAEYRLTTPNVVVALPKTTTTVTGEMLLCRSVWSIRSGVGNFGTAVARCRHGEEMFSCSSYSPSGGRSGERVEIQDGQNVCVAHSDIEGGVYAIARCCTGNRVQCQASASVQVGMDAVCPSLEHQLTGCSSYFKSKVTTDSTQPLNANRKVCPAKKGGTSHASCCRAPNLECRLIEHGSSGLMEQVEVSCEESWTLTGCDTLSHGSVTHGAYIRENTCVIPKSKEDGEASAIAICCRFQPPHQQSHKRGLKQNS